MFTPALETRNSSGLEGRPRRAVMAAMDGETPGIQATTDPPRLPEKRAMARRPGFSFIRLSFCSGISVPVERL